MAILRTYHLGSSGGLTDHSYDLVFTDGGEMFVQETIDYEQPYKKDGGGPLKAEHMPRVRVNGVPLLELVVKKLSEILPPSN